MQLSDAAPTSPKTIITSSSSSGCCFSWSSFLLCYLRDIQHNLRSGCFLNGTIPPSIRFPIIFVYAAPPLHARVGLPTSQTLLTHFFLFDCFPCFHTGVSGHFTACYFDYSIDLFLLWPSHTFSPFARGTGSP